MQLQQEHLKILKDISLFARVHRYHGMLPRKLALFYDEAAIDELLEAELIERVHFKYPCGSNTMLLRLTPTGANTLQQQQASDDTLPDNDVLDELTPEQWDVLSDMYHTSQLRRYAGILPLEKIDDERLNPKIINVLYARGFIIRVKAEMGSGKKRKGFIISNKGLRYLNLYSPMNS
ncbi:hypothetical protein [Megalodesulfovibrio paquesii]